jgi:hypothetical protein
MAEIATKKTWWETLERWSPTVFLVAGVLLLGYAIIQGVRTFAGAVVPSALVTAYGGIGLLVPVVGLLGLYPRLRDHTPRLSLAGVVVTILSGLLTLALLLWVVVTTLQMGRLPEIPADAPAWTAAALLLGFLLLAVAFLLFGVASLQTPVVSRTVAFLLLVPTAAWFGLLVGNVIATGRYLAVIAYIPISVALLAIGYILRSRPAPTGRAESAPAEVRRG